MHALSPPLSRKRRGSRPRLSRHQRFTTQLEPSAKTCFDYGAQAMEHDVSLQTIQVEISPRRIATVTLNRPDRGNAFGQTMLDELSAQFAHLGADENVRIVVLRGNGRHFCTGA